MVPFKWTMSTYHKSGSNGHLHNDLLAELDDLIWAVQYWEKNKVFDIAVIAKHWWGYAWAMQIYKFWRILKQLANIGSRQNIFPLSKQSVPAHSSDWVTAKTISLSKQTVLAHSSNGSSSILSLFKQRACTLQSIGPPQHNSSPFQANCTWSTHALTYSSGMKKWNGIDTFL